MNRQRRTYRSEKRAQESEATRSYILDATCDLLRDRGYPHFSVDDIATKAGVSRATVYVHFGSKSGVLQAVARRLDEIALENLMPDLLSSEDRVTAFRSAFGRVFAFFGKYTDLLRSLQAQAVYDSSFAESVRNHQQEIWQNTRRAVEWVAGESPLAAGWTVDSASDWVWASASFEMYDKLVMERGWKAEELVDTIMRIFDRTPTTYGDTTNEIATFDPAPRSELPD